MSEPLDSDAEPLAEPGTILLDDQRRRWRCGDRVPVEWYLAHRLNDEHDDERLLDLVYGEIVLREECGEQPRLDEYVRRFPQFAEDLRLPFEVHRAIRSAAEGGAANQQSRQANGAESVSPAARTDLPAIAGYDIERELGRGGMGVVYAAWQASLNRPVAIKMIIAGDFAGPQDLARFHTEAEAVARLQHPNIVQIYEVGQHEGCPYIAFEFVGGGNLYERLGGTPLAAARAAQLVETLARAIHFAHQQGVVHRDLTPSNVLLRGSRGSRVGSREPDADGLHKACLALDSRLSTLDPAITDFGLAKILAGSGVGQTQSGAVLGTPSYMAPEQAEGHSKQVGPTTDVYSLGAILYESLTGRPPFRADSPMETILQVLGEDPVPLSRLQPNVPRDLETICLKCLEKSPGKRYATAEALAEDLRRWQCGEPIRARPVGSVERVWRWCRRKPAVASLTAAVAVLLFAVAVGGVFMALRERWVAGNERDLRARAETARTAAELAREQETLHRLRAEDAGERTRHQLVRMHVAQGVRLMDEGDLLHAINWYVAALNLDQGDSAREENHRIRLGLLLDRCPKLVQILFHTGPVWSADWDTSGKRVVTASSDATARVWDVATGEAVSPPLVHKQFVLSAMFSPDGRLVVTASGDGSARVWDATNGEAVTPPLTHDDRVLAARFNHDGRRVVTASADATARVWDAQTGALLATLEHAGRVECAAFSHDGRRIVTASQDGGARLWDSATSDQLGTVMRHMGPVLAAEFSRDDRRVVTASSDGTARVWDATNGQPVGQSLEHRPGSTVSHAAWSPDGLRVATAGWDGTARVWDAETGEPVTSPLVHRRGVRHVQFSGDGKWLVTASSDGTARIWDARNARAVAGPLNHSAALRFAAFSADGSRVITVAEDNTARIWELRSDGVGELSLPEPYTATAAQRDSDEGRFLRGSEQSASVEIDSAVGHVVRISDDGSARVWNSETREPLSPPLTHKRAVVHAALSADGLRVATAGDDGTACVWNALTGERLIPPLKHGAGVLAVTFSSDGRRVITASRDFTARIWDTDIGDPVTAPLVHNEAVVNAAFSPEGRRVVTVGLDGLVRVWDAETGEPVSPPLDFARHVRVVWFSPDGSSVLAQSDDGTAWRWPLHRDGRPVEFLLRLARVLSGHALHPTSGSLPLDPTTMCDEWESVRTK
jgi:WD40 repeat protein/serine/threonine protein kinase